MTAVSYEVYDRHDNKVEVTKTWDAAKTRAKELGGTYKIIYTPIEVK